MKFCVPNLPEKQVKTAFVSSILSDEIKVNLELYGVKPINAPICPTLNSELSYHPDIVLNNPKTGLWYTVSATNMNKLLTKGKATLSSKYPEDCKYNCFIIDGTLYGGKKVADEIIACATKRVILAQGYTKCSTIILSNKDFITSDPTIYKALQNDGKNVLKVTNKGIFLKGYSCGFIGGCTGVLGSKTLAVMGDAKLLTDYEIIKDFCNNIGYQIISLSKKLPYDYGGILPITEDD